MGMYSSYRTLLGGVAAVCLTAAASANAADTVYVDVNDPTCRGKSPCFSTIQAGVNNAEEKVVVFPGTYDESVNLSLMGSAIGEGTDDLTLTSADDRRRPIVKPAVSDDPGTGPVGRAFYTTSGPGFDGDITIRGFVVTSARRDAINFDGVDGDVLIENVEAKNAAFDGVDVDATGKITCKNSEASDNGDDGFQFIAGDGVRVYNCRADRNGPDFDPKDPRSQTSADGFDLKTFEGKVVVEDSHADDNAGDGIDIEPTGDELVPKPFGTIEEVEIVRSSTSRNQDDGVIVGDGDDEVERRVIRDVSIDQLKSTGNGAAGAQIQARDTVKVEYLTAVDNTEGEGLNIGGRPFDPTDIRTPKRVELKHITAIGHFDSEGIQAHAQHKISIKHCLANRNGDGIEFDIAEGGKGEVLIEDCVANNNESEGINIDDAFASVTIRRVTANWNGFDPETGESNEDDGIQAKVNSGDDILIEDCLANGNSGHGLNLETGGKVEVTNCEASHNGFRPDVGPDDVNDSRSNGINVREAENGDLTLPDAIEIREVVTDGNTDDGIEVHSEGEIDIQRACAEHNLEDGIFVRVAGGKVRIKSSDLRNNGDTGLFLQSLGTGDNKVTDTNFVGNTRGLLLNTATTVKAEDNWWGATDGPTNLGGSGDSVIDASDPFSVDIIFDPIDPPVTLTFGKGVVKVDPDDLPINRGSLLAEAGDPVPHFCDELRERKRD